MKGKRFNKVVYKEELSERLFHVSMRTARPVPELKSECMIGFQLMFP